MDFAESVELSKVRKILDPWLKTKTQLDTILSGSSEQFPKAHELVLSETKDLVDAQMFSLSNYFQQRFCFGMIAMLASIIAAIETDKPTTPGAVEILHKDACTVHLKQPQIFVEKVQLASYIFDTSLKDKILKAQSDRAGLLQVVTKAIVFI